MKILFFLYTFIFSNEISTNTISVEKTTTTLEHLKTELLSINEVIKAKIETLNDEKDAQRYKIILNYTLENLNTQEQKELQETEEDFTKALLKIRRALISFYIKTNRYPTDIKELIPNFINSIPKIKINDEYSNSIKHVRTNIYDKDYTKAIDSTTTYLYFSDPKSSYWGFFIINSTNTYNNDPYYKY